MRLRDGLLNGCGRRLPGLKGSGRLLRIRGDIQIGSLYELREQQRQEQRSSEQQPDASEIVFERLLHERYISCGLAVEWSRKTIESHALNVFCGEAHRMKLVRHEMLDFRHSGLFLHFVAC